MTTKFNFTNDSIDEGTGTLNQLLNAWGESFGDSPYADRDAAIKAEQLALFAHVGLNPDTDILTVTFADRGEPKLKDNTTPGWLLIVWGDSSDPIFVLAKDGKPVAAYYVSCRGSMWGSNKWLAPEPPISIVCWAIDSLLGIDDEDPMGDMMGRNE